MKKMLNLLVAALGCFSLVAAFAETPDAVVAAEETQQEVAVVEETPATTCEVAAVDVSETDSE